MSIMQKIHFPENICLEEYLAPENTRIITLRSVLIPSLYVDQDTGNILVTIIAIKGYS